MKKKRWIGILLVLAVFASSLLAVYVSVRSGLDNFNQRHLVKTELNAQLASEFFKRELEEGQNITRNIEAGTVGNNGRTNRFVRISKYMLGKFDNIYSLQLIHKGQSISVYQDKVSRSGKAVLLSDPRVKAAFDFCRRKKINGIVGPNNQGEDKDSIAICQPIFIKGKFWGYAVALIKRKTLFKSTFEKLYKLGYKYRLSKTHILDGSYHTLNSNLAGIDPQAAVTFRLGGCSWRLEAVRGDVGQVPSEVKSSIISGIVIVVFNTILAIILVSYFERSKSLARMVDTDYLTDIMSRQAFDREARKYLEKHPDVPAVAASIDIDDFKNINDLYGHEAGDEALKAFSSLLKREFTDQGLVCRNGGDEFAVFLKQTDLEEGRAAFEKFYQRDFVFTYRSKIHRYTISLGFAAYPDQASSREELLDKADIALYDVKLTGKGAMQAFKPGMVKDGRTQLGFKLEDVALNLPGAFFIFQQDTGKILFANSELLKMVECDDVEDFNNYVGQNFKGLIVPEEQAETMRKIYQQTGDGDEGRAVADYHMVTKMTHQRLPVRAIGHMVKNQFFGKIHYVILDLRPEDESKI